MPRRATYAHSHEWNIKDCASKSQSYFTTEERLLSVEELTDRFTNAMDGYDHKWLFDTSCLKLCSFFFNVYAIDDCHFDNVLM